MSSREPTFAIAVVGVCPHPLSATAQTEPGRAVTEIRPGSSMSGDRAGAYSNPVPRKEELPMAVDDDTTLPTTAEALQAWRAAEQVAAVSDRGKLASDAAVAAARSASAAAAATATSAKAALEAATSAEATARATAEAAEAVIRAARQEADDAGAAQLQAGVDVATAHQTYRDAVARASKRRDGGG